VAHHTPPPKPVRHADASAVASAVASAAVRPPPPKPVRHDGANAGRPPPKPARTDLAADAGLLPPKPAEAVVLAPAKPPKPARSGLEAAGGPTQPRLHQPQPPPVAPKPKLDATVLQVAKPPAPLPPTAPKPMPRTLPPTAAQVGATEAKVTMTTAPPRPPRPTQVPAGPAAMAAPTDPGAAALQYARSAQFAMRQAPSKPPGSASGGSASGGSASGGSASSTPVPPPRPWLSSRAAMEAASLPGAVVMRSDVQRGAGHRRSLSDEQPRLRPPSGPAAIDRRSSFHPTNSPDAGHAVVPGHVSPPPGSATLTSSTSLVRRHAYHLKPLPAVPNKPPRPGGPSLAHNGTLSVDGASGLRYLDLVKRLQPTASTKATQHGVARPKDDERVFEIALLVTLTQCTPLACSTAICIAMGGLTSLVLVENIAIPCPGAAEDGDSEEWEPTVAYHYPPTAEDDALAGLIGAIPLFCFPDADTLRPSTDYATETFSFLLTDSLGAKRFGYCRRILPPGDGPRMPEVYCLVSSRFARAQGATVTAACNH